VFYLGRGALWICKLIDPQIKEAALANKKGGKTWRGREGKEWGERTCGCGLLPIILLLVSTLAY